MKRSGGFTLIELLVTITIMVILMTLAVFSARGVQANARDQERKSDIESIARGLEQRYLRGNPKVINAVTKGSYPGNNEALHANGWDWSSKPTEFSPVYIPGGYLTEWLPGTTKDSFTPPGENDTNLGNMWFQAETNENIENLTKNSDQYLYYPMQYDGVNNKWVNCYGNGECTRFQLYYWSEVEKVVKIVKSKKQ